MDWAIVQTHPCAERKAERHLNRQGFVCYLPLMGERRPGKEPKVQLLFPSYLFVGVEDKWRCLLGTFGVSKVLLQNKDTPAKLSDKFVGELKSRENKNGFIELPRDRYSKGQRVKITGGVFEGLSGLYMGASHRDREIVLLDILGRVELASSDLF